MPALAPRFVLLAALSLLPGAGVAQDMLRHVDLAAPRMSTAELTRASVRGLDLTEADLSATVLRDLVGGDGLVGLDSARNLARAVRD